VIVELIYDADCPNVLSARSRLIEAFTRTGISARWREWERSSPDAPDYARAYGSPTILVEGKDIAGVAPSAGVRACRVYSDARGNLSRTPSFEAISLALSDASRRKNVAAGHWKPLAASFPAVGTALLPKLTCPLCFPLYAVMLSALGIEFLDYTPYLFRLTAVFLAMAIAVLAFQMRRSGNLAPLILGITASLVVLFAKFYLESDWLTTGGIIMLVAAIFLSRRTKSTANSSCPTCAVDRAGQGVNGD
jgi:hypothetical protein